MRKSQITNPKMADPGNRRRLFYFLAAIAFIVLLFNLSFLSGTDQKSNVKKVPASSFENKVPHPETEKNASDETISDPVSWTFSWVTRTYHCYSFLHYLIHRQQTGIMENPCKSSIKRLSSRKNMLLFRRTTPLRSL